MYSQILSCSYLRLSTSNVDTLEDMMRKSGKDPGIHIHSDITGIDIWKNIKDERADLKEARTAAESAMSGAKHKAPHRARRDSHHQINAKRT